MNVSVSNRFDTERLLLWFDLTGSSNGLGGVFYGIARLRRANGRQHAGSLARLIAFAFKEE